LLAGEVQGLAWRGLRRVDVKRKPMIGSSAKLIGSAVSVFKCFETLSGFS